MVVATTIHMVRRSAASVDLSLPHISYYAHNFASPRTATLCVLSGPSQSAGMKKKRIIKLTTKQLKRKKLKRERGETLLDRRSKKVERDSARLDKKLAAKALW